MHEDIMTAFAEAVAREGGAVGRGPQRYYAEIHSEQFCGFVDLATHPWVTAVSEAVLGPDYEIVETGFDIPFPGPERDISARSALALHRGTANHAQQARPVVVLGVDAPGAGHAQLHDMMVTREFHATLPAELRRHLHARVVDQFVPIVQKHTIEGLVMGAS
jgi:hypothetical protein